MYFIDIIIRCIIPIFRIISTIKRICTNINPCLLSGASDVIVIKSYKGLQCTPFHAKFSIFNVVTPEKAKVYVKINGEFADLEMELGQAGEVQFIENEDPNENNFLPNGRRPSTSTSATCDEEYGSAPEDSTGHNPDEEYGSTPEDSTGHSSDEEYASAPEDSTDLDSNDTIYRTVLFKKSSLEQQRTSRTSITIDSLSSIDVPFSDEITKNNYSQQQSPLSNKESDIEREIEVPSTNSLQTNRTNSLPYLIYNDIVEQNFIAHLRPLPSAQSENEEEINSDDATYHNCCDQEATAIKRTKILTGDQLAKLNLKTGINEVEFSVITACQGTAVVKANLFYFDDDTKFVISDIDGTVTKSDILGHICSFLGRDWSHYDIAEFYKRIQRNGYQFIFLSARPIGLSQITRNLLGRINQNGFTLPDGPLLLSPDGPFTAFYVEVIQRKPEEFKIKCLDTIKALFTNEKLFFAGFGNRENDAYAYKTVGIPIDRIFIINPRGEIICKKTYEVSSTSYKNLQQTVDQIFPQIRPASNFDSIST